MAEKKGKFSKKKKSVVPYLLGVAAVLLVLLAVMLGILYNRGVFGKNDPAQKETQSATDPAQETQPQQGTDDVQETQPQQETHDAQETDPTQETDPAQETEPQQQTGSVQETQPQKETKPTQETEPTHSNQDVENAYIDGRGHLILVLKDGTKIDKGKVQDNTEKDPPASYLVVFQDYDGTALKNEVVQAGGSATPPAVPSREGYTFVGWSGSYTNVQDNVTVVAQYRQNEPTIETFTVTFVDGLGNVLKTQVVEKGKAAEAPADPVREGYVFTGWDKAFDKITVDLTVTAQFEQLPDTDPVILVETVQAAAGEQVQLRVLIRNNPGIAGARLFLHYDEKLTLTAADKGDAFSVLDYTAPAALVSGCAFNWDSLDAVSTADGTVLLLTFAVPAEAASGDVFRLELSFMQGDLYDVDLNDVEIDLEAGTITVK